MAAFLAPLVPELYEHDARHLLAHPVRVGHGGGVAWSMGDSIAYLRTNDLARRPRRRRGRARRAVLLGATVTGAICAKAKWGAYWNWDPRETTIFFLLLIYAAYLTLRARSTTSAGAPGSRRSTFAAAITPLLIFVVPRLFFTLHPDPIINTTGKLEMHPRMFQVFMASLVGFTVLFFWVYSLDVRVRLAAMRAEGEWAGSGKDRVA